MVKSVISVLGVLVSSGVDVTSAFLHTFHLVSLRQKGQNTKEATKDVGAETFTTHEPTSLSQPSIEHVAGLAIRTFLQILQRSLEICKNIIQLLGKIFTV